MGLYLGGQLVSPVIVKKIPQSKYGLTADSVFGDLVDGEIQDATQHFVWDLSGVKTVRDFQFDQFFFVRFPELISLIDGAVIPDLETVGSYGFKYALRETAIKSLYIGKESAVTYEGAFSGICNACRQLNTVKINIQNIAPYSFEYAFTDSDRLVELNLDSVVRVENYGFIGALQGCNSLKSISCPNLEYIGYSGMDKLGVNSGSVVASIETVSFPKLTTVETYGLREAFRRSMIKGDVEFPKLTTIAARGIRVCFADCSFYRYNLLMPELTYVGDYGMEQTCWNSYIELINFNKLEHIGPSGLQRTFDSCQYLQSEITFPALHTTDASAFNRTFNNTPITKIFFPSLVNINTTTFTGGGGASHYTFIGCDLLTEIHFRADAQATVESLEGYADKWGATNAVIYFDL